MGDMVQWFLQFHSKPEALGLSRGVMDEMLKPYISTGSDMGWFAQGMFVQPGTQQPRWPAPLSYIGGIGSYATAMGMWPRANSASDVVAMFTNRMAVGLPTTAVEVGDICYDMQTGRQFPKQVCDITTSDFFNYTLNRLVEIWDLGSSPSDARVLV